MRKLVPALVTMLVVVGAACAGSPANTSSGPSGVGSEVARPGDTAPNFTLRSSTGRMISLTSLTGRKPVLLYFSMGPG
jgi:cytochrome oxidase Cu insertion factor (SCO1/SenC/PrrC family)